MIIVYTCKGAHKRSLVVGFWKGRSAQKCSFGSMKTEELEDKKKKVC